MIQVIPIGAVSGTSTTLTIPALTCAVGDTLVIGTSWDVTDSTIPEASIVWNSETLVEIVQKGGTNNLNSVQFHRVATAGTSNAVITYATATTVPGGCSAWAVRIPGLVTSPVDVTKTAAGTGTSAASGDLATTAQDYEVLLASVGIEGPSTDNTGTWSEGFFPMQRVGNAEATTIDQSYAIKGTVGVYSATLSGLTSSPWAIILIALKSNIVEFPAMGGSQSQARIIDEPSHSVQLNMAPPAHYARAVAQWGLSTPRRRVRKG